MFKKKQLILAFLSGWLFINGALAQTGEGQHVGVKMEFNPIPASPNVAAFDKYGNLPVNVNTGVPQIEVPVYTIAMNGFSWPLRLSYHASGFKSEDIASRNGLGWSMQASGQVSHPSIMGTGDIELKRFLDLSYGSETMPGDCIPTNETDVQIADQYLNGQITSAPVIDNFQTAALGGRLWKGTTIPASDVKYISSNDMSVVYDDAGNKYEFALLGGNSRVSMCQGTNTGTPSRVDYLTRVITTKGEVLNFTYDAENYSYRLPDLHIKKMIDAGQLSRCYLELSPEDYYCQNVYYANEKRLKKIEGSNGTLIYFYYSSRQDLPGSTKLDQVDIWYKANGDSSLVKRVDFRYSYFGTGMDQYALQLKLNEVIVKGRSADSLNSYKFFYNTDALPYKLNSSIVFAANSHTEATYDISKAGILTKLQYPTGGYTTFDYKVSVGAGMLRIAEIRDFSREGDMSGYRSFKYNNPNNPEEEETSGVERISATFLEYETTYFIGNRTNNGTPVNCTTELPCAQPMEFLVDCNRTIWKNTPVRHAIEDYMDLTPRFPYVTEFFGNNGENGKIEYKYGLPVTSRNINDAVLLLPEYLNEKNIFKKTSGGGYELISKTLNQYETTTCNDTFFAESQHVKEARGWIKRVYMTRPQLFVTCCNPNTDAKVCISPQYLQYDARIANVPVYLKKTTQQTFDATGNMSVEQNFYYDEARVTKATRIETKKSNGDQQRIESRYPYYFAGNTVYDSMIARNIVSPVIEEYSKNITTNAELSHTKANYQLWHGNTLIEPATVQQSFKGNTLETQVTINNYDAKGNLLQLIDKTGVAKSFIWGYNKNYPVAQVVNAAVNEIFYDGFEQTGSWDGVVYDNTKSHTGKYSGRLDKPDAGEIVYHSWQWLTVSLTANKKFKYSGWIYSNGPSADIFLFMKNPGETGNYSYVDQVTTSVTGKWVYLEKEFEVPSSVIQLNIRVDNNGGGSVWFDDVRLHPAAAQMTTYTYDPMVGITSQSDLSGKPVYYEYDNFNRLLRIRDRDNYILKQYDYQYQQVAHTNAIWVATGNTRCQPCPANGAYHTNVQQQEEKDNNPNSSTYNQTRWTDAGVSGACTVSADWQNTGYTQCLTDGNGYRTGVQRVEQRDMNPCSGTYNQVQNVDITNTAACSLNAPLWQTTGTTRCKPCPSNGSYITNILQQEERDNNSNSSSYNQTRWVDAGTSGSCVVNADWQITGTVRCSQPSGFNNGDQEREERDMNPCSGSYNQTRWIGIGPNISACPIPCNSSNCYGENKKCVNNICETGIKVYTSSTEMGPNWQCTYHYEFSDGSWSENYTEISSTRCTGGGGGEEEM
ncbi:MAG: hypothetical protein QM731_03915 [Chitinophagaceae bacterium]